jgi:CPA2 family monovalent cation:H+ antiporter-2
VTSGFLYSIAVAVSVLTTLLTPYLIRSTDQLVNGFHRRAPRTLVNNLELYTRWVGQLGSGREASFSTKLVRRWFAQIGLNILLVAAVFTAAAFAAKRPPQWLAHQGETMANSVLWMSAMVLSLPLLIAIFRKLQAVGLLVAETKVTEAAAGERTAAIRAIVAQVIPFSGIAALGLLVLILSSTLLPPLKVLFVLLIVVGLITWLLWRWFIRVYSKAQIALQETFSQTPPPRATHQHEALPPLLREADLETVSVAPGSPAVGKLIRELELRTRTGASIVGIERNGASLINPGPDEELQAGDQIVLLGSRSQLDAAVKTF